MGSRVTDKYYERIPEKVTNVNSTTIMWNPVIRVGADKSLARPRRKQATVTKLGIYSTHSPQSSINFLAHSANICKPLKKKNLKVVRPTRSLGQQ